MKMGKMPKIVIGVVGVLIFLCLGLLTCGMLGDLSAGVEAPLPALLCFGSLVILSPLLMITGLSALERPWKAATGAFHNTLGTRRAIKLLNVFWFLFLGMGIFLLIFWVLPLINRGAILPGETFAMTIPFFLFVIATILGGLSYWLDHRDQ